MNPSTAQARVLLDELIRCGLRHAVLCPGSRNAPLSFALAEAAEAGRLGLHMRIDERSAAFLALGLAAATGEYVAVCCTSGTAVANLHPAMLEAWHGQIPLLALTADRPPELLGTGANQTTDQHGVFGPQVPTIAFGVAERRPGQNAAWRALICRTLGRADGPVHLNVPFREPLVPDADPDWPESLAGRPGRAPWTAIASSPLPDVAPVELPARTVVLLGSGPRDRIAEVAGVAAERGWPVIAEPHMAPLAVRIVRHGALLLAAGLPARLRPDAVVVAGRPTLSRGVQRLIATAPVVHVVDEVGHYADPQFAADQVHVRLNSTTGPVDETWLPAWDDAEAAATSAVKSTMDDVGWPTGLHVAAELLDSIPAGSPLLLGSSNPIRDVETAARPRTDLEIFANRGLAGIDGSIATAAGIAIARARPGYALLGDLTFLHDIGGLLVPAGETRPDLTIVVLNDDGGGIFHVLEQGAPEFADRFERLFGTPHGADLGALCAGYGVEYTRVTSIEAFRKAIAPAAGFRVVEVRADRSRLRDLHGRLRRAVRA
ncbi:MAG TPA: 2-succinyl-5-enolpyruvyl-6-hydroxy-3-cyclohexene-1-carboxylic-acid synthase [Mycobacteriales bacterium]|nr:2-succinyl-5-enolpyruvyl-6-hydroxy-3-cyclohexene-1-carboxylic-acid synthase [Mycobacteriales bacterium]